MLLTENEQKWSQILTEEFHVSDRNKLGWMSKYAQIHELKEGLQTSSSVDGGIYGTPLNTLGLGNPATPSDGQYNKGLGLGIGNTGFDFHAQKPGSGDIPMSTLPMALEIAATTIGFELVPVIPANGPWAMLTYSDNPYAGGKLGKFNETSVDGIGEGAENKPIYVKLKGLVIENPEKGKYYLISAGTAAETTADTAADGFVGQYLGDSRIDGAPIFKVVKATKDGKNNTITAAINSDKITVDLVTGAADHIQGFSNFASESDDPMTRAENETGVGNTIGIRMFSKWVQMGSYEVTGTVTRQQLQDMPLYGIDVIGRVLESMQNEISQAINNRILDRVFKLGVENAKIQHKYQGVDLNLHFGNTAIDLTGFSAHKKFVGLDGKLVTDWGTKVPSATANLANETLITNQRRIASRILAASNLIANVSRRGRADWVVVNTQLLTALQDNANFVIAPMVNDLTQDKSNSLYFAGSIAGLKVYVDPFMTWDDTRVCVGRKSDGQTPGVIFMPYILADTVQTVIEGTMAPKLLVNSRFAIVDAGFYPEQNYFTFMVQAGEDANIL